MVLLCLFSIATIDLPFAICIVIGKKSKLNNNNALCLKTDSDASDASVMHSFWQNTVESETQTRIMEFAATTMGNCTCCHKPANNGMKYSTRILTQQTPYGTELQNDTMGTIDDTSGV